MEAKCIKRRTHSIVDLLRDSKTVNFEYISQGECPYMGTCDRTKMKRTSIFPEVKHCMYDYTSFAGDNLQVYSRLSTVLHMDQKIVKFKTMTEVAEGHIWSKITDLRNPLFKVFSEELHHFPERISLDRTQCFEFNKTVFLQAGI